MLDTFIKIDNQFKHQNVSPIHLCSGPIAPGEEKVYHAYYQWVPMVLAFQAVMFYAPHWIWKVLENGRLKHIIVGLNNALTDDTERSKKVAQLTDYMQSR